MKPNSLSLRYFRDRVDTNPTAFIWKGGDELVSDPRVIFHQYGMIIYDYHNARIVLEISSLHNLDILIDISCYNKFNIVRNDKTIVEVMIHEK